MFQPFSTIESLQQNINTLEELEMADFSSIKSVYSPIESSKLNDRVLKEGICDSDSFIYSFKEQNVRD